MTKAAVLDRLLQGGGIGAPGLNNLEIGGDGRLNIFHRAAPFGRKHRLAAAGFLDRIGCRSASGKQLIQRVAQLLGAGLALFQSQSSLREALGEDQESTLPREFHELL